MHILALVNMNRVASNLPAAVKDQLDLERRVLRRKTKFLAEVLNIDDAILKRLLANELITDSEYREMRPLQPERRCAHIAEFLLQRERPFFDAFVTVLESANAAVAVELRAEIRLELGTLECTDTELEEASALVHRHFGSSRRMPETEKRKIANLIAMKAQVSRESNKREMSRIVKDLDKYRTITRQTENRLYDINSRIKRFVRFNDLEVQNPFIDLRSTTECLMLRPDSPKNEVIADLEDRVSFLMSRLMRLSAEKDTLIRFSRAEREASPRVSQKRLLPAIQITEHRVTTTADYGLVGRNGGTPGRSTSISQDALRERCIYVEAELKAKESLLEDLREELRQKQKQLLFMRGLLHAVGLNVPREIEHDTDLKTAAKGSKILVKGRITKAGSSLWSKPTAAAMLTGGSFGVAGKSNNNNSGNKMPGETGNKQPRKSHPTKKVAKKRVPNQS